METECPMVIALNMIDVIEKNHDALDIAKLEQKLGVPVVPISASTNKGIDNLMKKVVEVSKQKREPKTILKDSPIYPAIETMLHALEQKPVDNKLFYAIKLVDNDKEVVKKLGFSVKVLLKDKPTAFEKISDTDRQTNPLIAYKQFKENMGLMPEVIKEIEAFFTKQA